MNSPYILQELQLQVDIILCRDQGGRDKATSNPENFLGEVTLNLDKLNDWDGVVLDRTCELRQVRAHTIFLNHECQQGLFA
jgi:hypothetical protein